MDIATLVTARTALEMRGIRPAARRLGKAPARVSVALDRLEADLSMALADRAGSELLLTLEGERLAGDLGQAADLALAIARLSTSEVPDDALLQAAWLPIGLTALSRFATVATVGSIRRAAQRLNMGQPQLTRQIGNLERVMGCAMLDRRATGAAPTPDGERLRDLAVTLETHWAHLTRNAATRHRSTAQTVRLGTVMPLGHESPIAYRLAGLVANWHRDHPRQPLFIRSTTAEDLVKGLKDGTFDAAVLDTDHPPPDTHGEKVSATRLALIGTPIAPTTRTPHDHDWAELLQSAPLVVPSARSGLRQRINAFLADTLTDDRRDTLDLIELDSIPVIMNMVIDHGFLSILPRESVNRIAPALGTADLDPRYDLPLSLVWPHRPATARTGAAIAAMLRRGD